MICAPNTWHPVGYREASEDEFKERKAKGIPEPKVVHVGAWPEPNMVYFVTLINGAVDIDEFDIDGTNDWFWFDAGSVAAWMSFPLWAPEEPNLSFWHKVEDELPKTRGAYLVCFNGPRDFHYIVEEFSDETETFVNCPDDPVAWAELPEPYVSK